MYPFDLPLIKLSHNRQIARVSSYELSPVAAIVGGIVAGDMIKAISVSE
jgi:hypothetical protein